MVDIVKPALKVFYNIVSGDAPAFAEEITEQAIGWRRSIHSQGGYWMGTFKLEGDLPHMLNKFYHWLGNHLEETSGGVKTWEGMIYEMDLSYRGQIRRKSLDFVRNYWTALYSDEEGETQQTAAASDIYSIGRYGRYEGMITIDQLDATAAAAMCTTYLNQYAWPYARGVALSPKSGDVATLEVTVLGYIFTMNWRFISVGDGTLDNLSDWIGEIVAADCEYAGTNTFITENTLQIYKLTSRPQRALDVINSLTMIGDASGNPYRFYVDNERRVFYAPISVTPSYHLINEAIMTYGGELRDPWRIRPAVIRDHNWSQKETMPSGWLTDSRDFYASQIDVGVDTGLAITTDLFDESELLLAQLEEIGKWIEEPEEEEED